MPIKFSNAFRGMLNHIDKFMFYVTFWRGLDVLSQPAHLCHTLKAAVMHDQGRMGSKSQFLSDLIYEQP